ncbi:Zinc finger and BTB domain-containing protein 48 [Armadillidium nasatum]|uniref:Zinc finger and BTB domain-containing protein 48 n=1 Tax=Armadillidium nasatum TaxID=96803 RepID=A0A5N5STT4_9CRUS|nr:Zinc finger and BTB domain-containing protein 48 [Armadillidium nasatum]
MSGILCLKWNNHTNTFIQNLDILRTKELYCDVTLTCCGKFYPVHRFVLTTCSEFFQEIFSRTQCKHPFIVLNEINHMALDALLQYMYKGEVNVLQENLPGLIRAAEALKIKGFAVPDEESEEKRLASERNSHQASPSYVGGSSNNKSPILDSPIDDSDSLDKDTDLNNIQNSPQSTNFDNVDDEKLGNDESFDAQDDDLVENENNEDIPVKVEKSTEEIDERFSVPYVNDPPAFLSLLNSDDKEEEDEEGDSVADLVMPQCSSWTDSLPDSDSVNKENLESSWLQTTMYDSFPLDPLHYLSTASNSDSASFSPFALSESSPVKEEKKTSISKSNSNSCNNKNHKYQCIECQFSTNDKAAFRLHTMRRHTGEKPFACSVCSYRCTTKDMLKIHTRKHTGEKPFSCPYCNCRMTVKSSLKRHILLKHIQTKKPKSESSELHISPGSLKTYKCNYCSYESQMKSNLKLHCMRIHTGEKPIACTLCTYRTTTKPQLEKHMRRHTGEKPFPCTFCPYRAAQKHTLLRHMSLHTK